MGYVINYIILKSKSIVINLYSIKIVYITLKAFTCRRGRRYKVTLK